MKSKKPTKILSLKHEHEYLPVFGINELAFYECKCGAVKPSTWNGEED